MADQNSPLNDSHYDAIVKALDAGTIAEQQIEMAKRAGIDVSAREKQFQDAKAQLLQIKNVYFSNK